MEYQNALHCLVETAPGMSWGLALALLGAAILLGAMLGALLAHAEEKSLLRERDVLRAKLSRLAILADQLANGFED